MSEEIIKVPVQKPAFNTIDSDIAREAYKEYVAQTGNDQSFERIHQRGGFCWAELAVLLYARLKRLEGISK
ncbi:Uncharacterised protein [Serratia quinivorans]|uniref:hypothetical protein n=1 Tax=Serratia quinivorans TaxID=137545 RepID=UPI00217772BB|nr:hypothetical protein [Serratia quinivorans]CAI1526727.1 Uncharacterised protein [Serratia quinivorans]